MSSQSEIASAAMHFFLVPLLGLYARACEVITGRAAADSSDDDDDALP